MQLSGLTIGIIADDLTGANDTALQFFMAGYSTRVLTEWEESSNSAQQCPDTQVWALNTASRHMNPQFGIAAVRQAIRTLQDNYGVDRFYKKIDSTLRGNIAQECLAVLDELKADCAVIAPAFPQEGRRTVGGYQLLRGLPIEQTEVARDPLCPVRQSHVPTLLASDSRPEIIGHIPLSTVLHGAGPILVTLNEHIKMGKKLVVVDACSTVDLEQIALAIQKIRMSSRVIPCGSAGLAQAITRLFPATEEAIRPPHIKPAPILIVSGSNATTTHQQLEELNQNYPEPSRRGHLDIIELTPAQVLGQASIEPEISRVVELLKENKTVVISTAFHADNLPKTFALAAELDIPNQRVTQLAQEQLSAITVKVLDRIQPLPHPHLIFCGGETSNQLCKVLGVKMLEISGEAELAIPLTQDPQGRWVITKSGNMGSSLALCHIVEYLKALESASLHA